MDSLKEIIILTASYYRQTISEVVLGMYASDLSDLPVEKVIEAYTIYRRNPKNKFFPLPAQIREIINPEISNDSLAREVVEKIKIAIRKFGYSQSQDAESFIGHTGWTIVRGLGGWLSVCESDFIHNQALVAQARQRAVDLITHGNKLTEYIPIIHEQKKQIDSPLQKANASQLLETLYKKTN